MQAISQSSRVPPTGISVSKKKQVAKPSLSAANLSRPAAPSQFCHHCKRKGHIESSCLRKKKCDYCHRQGHSIQDCHTRLAEERQQQFLHRISTEQAQNNAIPVQSLSRLLAPASLHPAASDKPPQGNWAAQPQLPPHQQPLQTYSGPTQLPYKYPGVWNHAGQ